MQLISYDFIGFCWVEIANLIPQSPNLNQEIYISFDDLKYLTAIME